jgi:hypothetical protein
MLNFFLAAVYSDTADNFYTSTIYGISLLLYSALARMAHDDPCLHTSGIGNTNVWLHPRHAPESGKLGIVGHLPQLLWLQLCLPQVDYYYNYKYYGEFFWLNNDIDHNNINPIDFIYGDYITNDTIDRDYNTPSFMATSATRATTLPPTCALVRPFASLPIRLWLGRVRVYHSFAIFDSLIL